MKNKRFVIGRRNLFRHSLSLEDRMAHLLLTPSKGEITQRFWFHLLQKEMEQPCSSLIFTHDPDVSDKIATMVGKKVLLRLEPGHPDSLSLNPFFHSDHTTAKWLANFFFEKEKDKEEEAERHLSGRKILEGLFEIAANDSRKERSLPDIYRQVSLGLTNLKEWLFFHGRPFHLALLDRIDRIPQYDQVAILRDIYARLALFQDARIEGLFSRSTSYAPIYHHERSVLLVCIPRNFTESQRLLRLSFLSIAHQLLSHPPGRKPLPLYIHLDQVGPLPEDLFPQLSVRHAALTCLAERAEGLEGCRTEIRMAEGRGELIRDQGAPKEFRPALAQETLVSPHE